MWQAAIDEPESLEWRGKVQALPEGEAYYFRGWPGLIGRLEAMLKPEAVTLSFNRGLCSPFGQKKSLYGVHVGRLASITNPVLVIWGRRDRVIPAAHAEAAANGLPNVRVQLLDNCGHMPMLEQTDAFNASLLEFLGR